MKLFYFTGTGNSLYIAKKIKEKFENAEIVSIIKVTSEDIILDDNDVVGFIFPVYAFGMPNIVRKFIKKILYPKNKNIYTFAIINPGEYGGNAMKILVSSLKKREILLDSGFVIDMPNNYIILEDLYSEDRENKQLSECDKKIEEIAKIVSKKEKRIEKSHNPFGFIFTAIYYIVIGALKFMDRWFWVDDNCNSCAICVKICPVKNIVLENGKPKWLKKCEQCVACINLCPKKAIQFGKITQKRGRYINKYIKLKEFLDEQKK